MQTATMSTAQIGTLLKNRRPGFALERPFYTDQSIFDLDIRLIFGRFWLFVGHACQIPQPGDYFTYTLAGDPLIIIRGDDQQIRALWNVCRHRGSQICVEPQGNVKSLICPYHQWVFRKDGSLASARMMPPDFDKQSYGLHQVHIRVVGGLIFINFADEPVDFSVAERDIEPYVLPYELETAKVAHRQVYNVPANWKLIVENSRECYHCGGGHPEYCHAMIGASLTESRERVQAVHARDIAAFRELGIATEHVRFEADTWHEVKRNSLQPGFVSQSLDGRPVGPVMGRLPARETGVCTVVTYPNFWFEASSDHVWTMRLTPVAPTHSELELTWLVRGDAREGVDYDVERVSALWRATGEQDQRLVSDNQAGVNARSYQPGPYAPSERELEKFVAWYINELRGMHDQDTWE